MTTRVMSSASYRIATPRGTYHHCIPPRPRSTAQLVRIVSLRDQAGHAPADAAVYPGVGYSTLKKWRGEGRGPKYATVGNSVLYRPCDLDAFVKSKLMA